MNTYVTYSRDGINRIGESVAFPDRAYSRKPNKPIDYDKLIAEGNAEHDARVAADPLYCSKGATIHHEL